MTVKVDNGLFRVYRNAVYVACFKSLARLSEYIMLMEGTYDSNKEMDQE